MTLYYSLVSPHLLYTQPRVVLHEMQIIYAQCLCAFSHATLCFPIHGIAFTNSCC